MAEFHYKGTKTRRVFWGGSPRRREGTEVEIGKNYEGTKAQSFFFGELCCQVYATSVG